MVLALLLGMLHVTAAEVQAATDAACPPEASIGSSVSGVAGTAHEDAIHCAIWWGIARGYGDDTFPPVQEVSRAQMATFLDRTHQHVVGERLASGSTSFEDLGSTVHADAIARVAAADIAQGVTAQTFAPDDPVTRGQMASFLVHTVDHLIRSGQTSPPSVSGPPDAPVVEEPPPACPSAAPTDAWCALYWDNRSLSGDPVATARVARATNDWGASGPGHGIGDDFSVRFERRYSLPAGRYRFYLLADDRVRLFINGQERIGWNASSGQARTPTSEVAGGTRTIRVEFAYHTGLANLNVNWTHVGDLPADDPAPSGEPTARVEMPFTGGFDRFGHSHPAWHRLVYDGDWSTDLYATPGTQIRANVDSSNHDVRLRVDHVRPGCASGVAADGGYEVRASVISGGQDIGWVSWMHVSSPQASAGQTLSPGALLGTTSRFRYSSCYQVTTEQGAHVHLEVGNEQADACYLDHASGTELSSGALIGKMGGSYASGIRTVCP